MQSFYLYVIILYVGEFMKNSLNHVAIIMDGNGRWAKEKGMRSFVITAFLSWYSIGELRIRL